MPKKVFITGGSGLLGRAVSYHLEQNGYLPCIFTRNIINMREAASPVWEYYQWSNDPSKIAGIISGSKAVVNLAGASLAAGRWTDEYKREITSSRIDTTRTIVEAIKIAEDKPVVFVSASAVGYYGSRGDEIIDETSQHGIGFLSEVCKSWESAASEASPEARTVLARIGIVLDKREGALGKMLPFFKMYAGGPLGSGRQWLPWIHIDDVARMFVWAIENDNVVGAINFCNPNPSTMKEFAKELGKAAHRPSIFPVPGFVLKIMLGEAAEMVLSGQRAIPRKALELGFNYNFSNLFEAFSDIIKNRK